MNMFVYFQQSLRIGNRPVIVNRALIGSKGGAQKVDGSSAQYLC